MADSMQERNLVSMVLIWTMNKVKNFLGIELAESGAVRQPSIVNIMNPIEVPKMLIDLHDSFHNTFVSCNILQG